MIWTREPRSIFPPIYIWHTLSSVRRSTRDIAVLVVLTAALHLPFIGQAYHLDDDQYLDIAENVYRNPWFPLDMPAVFEGQHLNFWGHTHPPLNGYVIAGVLLLRNRTPSEVFLHACFIAFSILATLSFYFLARRFTPHPFVAAAILAVNPTLMVCAHTLMTDVPLLALWLCACVLFISGFDQNRPSLMYISSFVIT